MKNEQKFSLAGKKYEKLLEMELEAGMWMESIAADEPEKTRKNICSVI